MSGQFNLWRVPVEGGWPDQLTAFTDETVRGVGVSPRDGTLVSAPTATATSSTSCTSSTRPEAGPSRSRTSREVQHFVGGWSLVAGRHEARVRRERAQRRPTWRSGCGTWTTGETRNVFGEGMYAFPGGWSPDGTKLLARRLPQQQRHVDPPGRSRSGERTRADAARRGRHLRARALGAGRLRASTC